MLHVAKAFPRMKFLLVNWLFLDGPRMVAAGLKGRCLIDFARMQVIFRKELPRLMASLGPEAFAFGSHMPFEYVAPSLVKLADVQLFHAASYEKIAWQNAVRFLGLQ